MKMPSRYRENEQGNISMLFAFAFVFIILLVGFATDVGLMYCKRAELLEIGQMARDARFNETEYFENSPDPDAVFHDIVVRSASKNNIEPSQVRTTYRDTSSSPARREYEVDIYIEQTYKYSFLKILGADECKITVHIPGTGFVENSNGVWMPYY